MEGVSRAILIPNSVMLTKSRNFFLVGFEASFSMAGAAPRARQERHLSD